MLTAYNGHKGLLSKYKCIQYSLTSSIYTICVYTNYSNYSFLICHTQFQIFIYTVHIIYNVYNLIQVVSYIMYSLLAVNSKTVNISCKSITFTQTFLILLYYWGGKQLNYLNFEIIINCTINHIVSVMLIIKKGSKEYV